MASIFKKPKRNFRRKGTDFDVDSDNESKEEKMEVEEEQTVVIQPVKKKKHKSKDKEQKKTVLSFEVEDDDSSDVFKVKKSSVSRRLTKQMRREKKEKEKDTDRDGDGRESRLEDMENDDIDDQGDADRKKNGEAHRRHRKEEEERAAAEKLKKLREEFRTLNGEEAEAAAESEDDGQKTFKNMLARGEIPDAKTIHFIRKQRQMARETDFIPLEETEAKTGKSTTARLVRDDDDDKSDDEEERVDFSVNQAARERQEMRDNFLAAEHGSDEESDQEREWEKQQIRKAVSLQIPGVELPSNDSSSCVHFVSSASSEVRAEESTANGDSGQLKPLTSLAKSQDSSSITIESVRKRLQERLDIMDSVYRTHKLELDRAVSDLTESKEIIESCGQKAPDLESRFRFFQELRGYVRDLIECLNEKVPVINHLEQRINSLLKSRADRLLKRRQQDVQDQCRDYMTSASSIKVDAETAETQARQRRAAEREARRARRRRAREAKNIGGHHDGLSSDDEESSQSLTLKFNAEMDEITAAQEDLFEDVVEDFADLEAVKCQFEKWKFTYGDTYRDAYIGLCLPKLVNPFIRRELLLWNPLDENCRDYEDSSWFSCLIFLGCREAGEELDRNDDDIRLVPSIVEKVILPKMTYYVENVWDPLSTTQTARLVTLSMRLVRDYPTIHAKNKQLKIFLEKVVERLKKTLDDDVFMPMYPLSVLDNRSSGPSVFFHRQSWTCIKLFGNFLSWHQLISAPVLQKLAFSGLLNRYIVVGLVSSHINREALQKCQAIISSFPKDWFSSLDGDSTLPQLENLCRYLVSAAKTLHKATALESDTERLEGRDLVKQISKHLVNIHAMDHAMALANEFSFKISQV